MAEGGGLLNRYTAKSRIVGSNPILSANILLRINEMARYRAKNPQLPRRFGDADRTSETAEKAEIGL